MKIIDTLIPRWQAQKVGLMPPNSTREIEVAFSKLGCRVAMDAVELYLAIGGMDVMEDDAYWRLWSLAEIIEENTESSPAGILFSDHLMHSWSYRLKYETESRSSVYIEHFDPKRPPKKLFDGLEEFLVAYAENPGAILQ